jgi:hypothetical protein
MAFRFNPFTGNLDEVGSSTASAGGSDTQVQVNDGGNLAGFIELLWNKISKVFTVKGDIRLDDGGSFTTTVQCVTPTANRVISFPNATGTVALVGGTTGQVLYNNGGALAGINTLTFDGTTLTTAGRMVNTFASIASTPAKTFAGTWFTGGTATTTKPHLLIEPAGTTSTAWSTAGTGLGVNAPSGFTGNLLDLQVNGTSRFRINNNGDIFGNTVSASLAGLAPATSFAALTYGATVNLDLAALDGQVRTITLTGNLELTNSNLAAGRRTVIRLLPGASQRSLTFPIGWVFYSDKPATIAANKGAVLSLTYFGSSDTDCVAMYRQQP